jgi:hypothetical protein
MKAIALILVFSIEEGLQLRDKQWQVLLNSFSDSFKIDLKVFVRNDVSHVAHDTPWNCRITRLNLRRNVSSSFANNHKIIENCFGKGFIVLNFWQLFSCCALLNS